MASAEELLLSDDDGLDWDWDDSTFVDQDQIFTENPDLENIEDFFEEEEL
jgi:hypothetical protein